MKQTLVAPREGQGLHDWIRDQSRDLLMQGISPEVVKQQLLEATVNSGRTTQDPETEIDNLVEGAREYFEEHPPLWRGTKKPKWIDPLIWIGEERGDRRPNRLPPDPKKRRRALKYNPIKTVENAHLEFKFSTLFSGIDFLLCAVRDQKERPLIQPLSNWIKKGKLEEMQYIVPNYFRGYYGRRDLGIGRRLFVVIEFDEENFDEQTSMLNYLSQTSLLPLIMMVFSGNRSIHGWFACYGISEHRIKTFCLKATELGADRTTLSYSQYVRCPMGWNYKKRVRQQIWYFDKNALYPQTELLHREVV